MGYVGKSSDGFGVRERYRYSASGSQTAFTGSDLNGKTLLIDNGSLVDVYLNGVLLDTADYNTSTANQITLTSGATASDEVMILVYDVFALPDAVPKAGGAFTGAVTVEGKSVLTTGSAGAVLQVVQDTKTDTFATTSTSFVDVTGLSVAITPSSTSSKILVLVQVNNNASQTYTKFFDLVRGSTSIFKGDDASDNKRECTIWGRDESDIGGQVWNITYLDSPSSTSELTYKLQASVQSGGTLVVNKSQNDGNQTYLGRGTSSITVMEIAG